MRKRLIPIAMLLLASTAQGQSASRRASIDPWEVTEQTALSVTLELPALNLVRGSVFQVRPVLVVRCRDKELEVFVLTGSALDSNDSVTTPVRVHWGTGTGDDGRWNRSTDGKSAFTPDPRGFLRQLVDAPDLRLEVHPAGGSPQLIRFNARGIDRHVVQVNSVCPVRRI